MPNTPVFDAASEDSGGIGDVTSLSWSHTVTAAQQDEFIGTAVLLDDSVLDTPTCKYNSVSMTVAGSVSVTDLIFTAFKLAGPATGSNTVLAEFNSARACAKAMSFYDVDQTTPVGTPKTTSGSGTSGSLIPTNGSNWVDWFACGQYSGFPSFPSAHADQTARGSAASAGKSSSGTQMYCHGSTEITSDTDASWTCTNGNYAYIGWELNGSPSGAPEINVKFGATPIADGGTHAHGNAEQDSSVSVQFTIENTGTADLDIGTCAVDANGSIDAGDDPSNTTVLASQSTTITVNLTTSALGAKTCNLDIPSNDADEPTYDIAITFTVFEPEINCKIDGNNANSGTILVLPPRQVGEVVDVVITIESTEVAPTVLNVGTIVTAGDYDSVQVDGSNSNISGPSGTATHTVRTETSTPGVSKQFTLSIPHDDDDGDENPYTYTINYSVHAIELGIELVSPVVQAAHTSGNQVDLGAFDKDEAVTFTMKTKNLAAFGDVTTGLFTTTGDLTENSVPGESEVHSVLEEQTNTFDLDTSTHGAKSGQISIASDDPDSPHVIPVVFYVRRTESSRNRIRPLRRTIGGFKKRTP